LQSFRGMHTEPEQPHAHGLSWVTQVPALHVNDSTSVPPLHTAVPHEVVG